MQQHVVASTLPDGRVIASVNTLYGNDWIRDVYDLREVSSFGTPLP